jgi:beta-N-acetylhexosaminidase
MISWFVATVVVVAALAVLGCGAGPVAKAAGEPPRPSSVTSKPATPTSAAAPSTAARARLAGWSDRRLAAQLVWCSVPADDPLAGRKYVQMGVGGVVILGGGAHQDIGSDLAALLRTAPHGVEPFIASDEEGGLVQRLRDVVYPLPSARVQGGWSTSKTQAAAADYGARLRKLHVSVVFGPVADLDVPGRYMSALDRCFSSKPSVVASHVVAWVKGLKASRVMATVKHWPGHGWASNTHSGAGRVPSFSRLRREDMVPFERAFAAGVPLVMVGHLQSKGLTEPDTPASVSPSALRYLRSRAGAKTLIVTDSLSMAATTKALGIGTPEAAVRALKAGADLALFASADPGRVIDAVTAAIRSGRLPRARAEASVSRILKGKEAAGLAPAAAR